MAERIGVVGVGRMGANMARRWFVIYNHLAHTGLTTWAEHSLSSIRFLRELNR